MPNLEDQIKDLMNEYMAIRRSTTTKRLFINEEPYVTIRGGGHMEVKTLVVTQGGTVSLNVSNIPYTDSLESLVPEGFEINIGPSGRGINKNAKEPVYVVELFVGGPVKSEAYSAKCGHYRLDSDGNGNCTISKLDTKTNKYDSVDEQIANDVIGMARKAVRELGNKLGCYNPSFERFYQEDKAEAVRVSEEWRKQDARTAQQPKGSSPDTVSGGYCGPIGIGTTVLLLGAAAYAGLKRYVLGPKR